MDEVEDFDTTLTGPQMEKWDIVTHNRHIDAYLKEKASQAASSWCS